MRACLALVLVPALAHADEVEPIDEPVLLDQPKPVEAKAPIPASEASEAPHWRLEGGMGVRVGSARLDSRDVSTVVPGFIEGGFRRDRLLLYGEYQLSGVSFPAQSGANVGQSLTHGSDGLQHRLGASARYAFARIGESDGNMEVYAEGGVGVEHVQWDAGGAWTRPDVSAGLGVAMWGFSEDKHGGISLGIRITIARRSDISGNEPAVCGGPCDVATTPTGYDRSFLFDAQFQFGR
jgi:hypothetical protein